MKILTNLKNMAYTFTEMFSYAKVCKKLTRCGLHVVVKGEKIIKLTHLHLQAKLLTRLYLNYYR